MAKIEIPETFRCHATMRGEKCPCDITLVNTFTFFLTTLDRKTMAAHGALATTKTIKEYALCPWHAAYLKMIGSRDIVRLDGVAELVVRREEQARRIAAEKNELNRHNARLASRNLAHMPRLGAALVTAGIRA